MNRTFLLPLVLILLILAIGCEDDGVSTKAEDRHVVVFPQTVGSLWTYDYLEFEITDDDTALVDSVTVDVVVIGDTTLANGNSATIWVFRYERQAVADTVLMETAGDSLKVEWDTKSLLGAPTTILLPIDTSLTWVGGDGFTDTTTVSGPRSFLMEGSSFLQAYLFERRWVDLEDSEETDIWLMPDIGIRWYSFSLKSAMSPPSERLQLWRLMSYDLP